MTLSPAGVSAPAIPLWRVACLLALSTVALLWADSALAHAVTLGDKGYIQETTGVKIIPFLYLGAKHMVTGYDHILFLFGVIFFLYGMKEIGIYVTLFAIGHSTTMLAGVWFNFGINSYIIDAIIGFSVVYKALDNLGAFKKWFGVQPDTKAAALIFGFLHGSACHRRSSTTTSHPMGSCRTSLPSMWVSRSVNSPRLQPFLS